MILLHSVLLIIMNDHFLSNIRKVHSLGHLLEEETGENPFKLFSAWLSLAVEDDPSESNAFSLSTSDHNGKPSSRMMLLKELDSRGFVFYTNYESRKGKELSENPQSAMLFFWPRLEKQIRIEGKAEKVSRQETEKYFSIRPRESQLGAHASKQSRVIPDRSTLDSTYQDLEKKFENQDVPAPESWGGFRLIPDVIEFWQGRPSRLHDRIRFRLENKKWIKERLNP